MYELNLKSWVALIVTALFLIIGGVGSCMYIRTKYNVWSQEMAGKAEFAKAEQNRKIKIEEAKANLEAEMLNAANGKSRLGCTVAAKFSRQFSDEVSWQKVDPTAAAAASGEEDITEGGAGQGGNQGGGTTGGELEG